MEPLAKLRIIAQAARPGADVSEDFDQLVKGLEIKGVTQNPKQFHEYMEGIAKGLNVFGDTLRPYQYYEMFKFGRQATPSLSERFILGTAPTLAQELGGSSYGKAVSAFNAAIVGGIMKHSALTDFESLGLVRHEDLLRTRTGEAKGLKPGMHIQGWRLAQSDPNEWIKQYLLPALERAGVKDKDEILQRISALFQNQMASQLVGMLATQQSRIDKDMALLAGAHGLGAADIYQSKDPSIAFSGLKHALEGLGATLGSQLAAGLATPMNDLARAIAGYTDRLTHFQNVDPNKTPTYQKRFNALMNDAFYGDPNSLKAARNDHRRRMQGLDDKYEAASSGLAGAGGDFDDLDRDEKRLARLDIYGPPTAETAALRESVRRRQEAHRALGELADAHEARIAAQSALDANDRRAGGYNSALDLETMRRGMTGSSVAPGLLAFGPTPHQTAPELKGAADINLHIEVTADTDAIVKRVEQSMYASGALRSGTGVSMPEAAPGGMGGGR